ncbi:MAG: PA2169 family four-helix-bundle protein [Chitinophagaceae bacterium]
MATNDSSVEILNDLIQINNDRVEGYKRAIKEADDSDVDLKSIFQRMEDESRQYLSELNREVVKLGGEPTQGTTVSGKIYRAWMDVKATFTGSDRLAVLENCEFGEDAAQKAYKEALESDDDLSLDLRQLISNQKASLKVSHDTIKRYRDMHKAAKSDSVSDSSDNVNNAGAAGSYNKKNDDFTESRNSGSSNLGDIL